MSQQIAGYCTLCRSRCGSVNHVQNGRLIKVTPLPGHPTGGALCAKGRSAPEQVESPLRLSKPLKRTTPRGVPPEWVEISWDQALDEVAAQLSSFKAQSGAESVAFAVTTPSGTPMVDSFEWVERLIRCYGSPNLIYAVEVCGWHKDYAHALTFGRGIGIPDLEHADVMVLWGHNPARTWLAQASRIATSKKRGAKLVVIDPKIGGSAEQADLWLRVRPGSDAALALCAIRHLIETKSYDHKFVASWTNAPLLLDQETGLFLKAADFFEHAAPGSFMVVNAAHELCAYDTSHELSQQVKLCTQGEARDRQGRTRRYETVFEMLAREVEPYTVDEVATITWCEPQAIREFIALFASGRRIAYHSWTGLGQHTNATQTERAVATLYALTGACDNQGGNLWSVAPPYRMVNDYESLLAQEQRDKALGLPELPLGPPSRGWITARDFAQAVLEKQPYAVHALVSFGTNFIVSQADAARNERALRALQFHVHVDMFMNPTAENADIVLPANMPWEREALKLGFEITQAAVEHVQLRQQMLPSFGESRADYEIAFALAERLGLSEDFFGGSIEAGWNHQIAPLGITLDDLRAAPEGMRFEQSFSYHKYRNKNQAGNPAGFRTPTRRVELYSEALLAIGQAPVARFIEPAQSPANQELARDYPLVLTTAKSGWFVHTSHRHVASLRKKSPNPQAQISTALAAQHKVNNGDWIRVITPTGNVALQARIDEHLHDRVVIAEFGWWQGCEALGQDNAPGTTSGWFNINAILSDAERDPVSGSVPLRASLCRIARDDEMSRGLWQGRRPFTVSALTMESQDVAAVSLAACDGGPLPDFLPGQHVVVSLPGHDVRRAYSLTGPNRSPGTLSIGVRRSRTEGQPDGLMSALIHQLAVGDLVYLTSPSGVFTIPVATTRPVIVIGSGIGITPFVGYLEALAQQRHARSELVFVNICRNSLAHPFKKRILELSKSVGKIRLITVYWDPLDEDLAGRDYDYAQGPDFSWFDDDLIRKRPLAYLCGSPDFLEKTKDGLVLRGMPGFDIFAETFTAETRVPDTLAPQEVCIEGEPTRFQWRPNDGSLLDAADTNGITLPSGCRVGQCESCEMQIVSGQVVHLSPYDGPSTSCLTCRAVPITALVLRR